MAQDTQQDFPAGFAFAITAYVLWGFLPLYMKAVDHIGVAEVLAHRVIWSVPVAGALLIYLGRTKDFVAALKSPRMLAMGALTAFLISVNWGLYVWAVIEGFAIEAALGYYINPLFSVALGALVLRERLTRAQLVAVALATLAVVVLIVDGGGVPFAALGMMLSFGLYALCKRRLPIGPNQGFLLEVVLLLPVALVFVVYLTMQGGSHFVAGSSVDTWLLLGCGVVTAVPLLCYANGAKLLRLSTIGILQYIAPTLIFINAVFVFGEPFDRAKAIAFPLIWLALIVYTGSMLRSRRSAKTVSEGQEARIRSN